LKRNTRFTTIIALLSVCLITAIIGSACNAPEQPDLPPASIGPKYGGTLHLAYVQDITFLDPTKSPSAIDRALPHLYSNTLVKWTGKNDESPKVEPSLATKWDISTDGLVYTFYLRQGVKWHNLPPVNGREFTSSDVKFAIDRIADPKNKLPLSLYFAAVDHIETPDKYTVKIFMKTPDPSFIFTLCGTVFGAREVAEQDGDFNKTVIGTGPFMLEKYTPGVGITFVKNPDYWEKGKPYLDRVECTFMSDPAQRLAAFRAGQIDRLVEGLSNTELIQKSVKDVVVVPGVNIIGSGLAFSLKQAEKPFANKQVRQAIQYAIDYDGLIQAVLNGAGSRTDYLAPSYRDWGARTVQELPQRVCCQSKIDAQRSWLSQWVQHHSFTTYRPHGCLGRSG